MHKKWYQGSSDAYSSVFTTELLLCPNYLKRVAVVEGNQLFQLLVGSQGQGWQMCLANQVPSKGMAMRICQPGQGYPCQMALSSRSWTWRRCSMVTQGQSLSGLSQGPGLPSKWVRETDISRLSVPRDNTLDVRL